MNNKIIPNYEEWPSTQIIKKFKLSQNTTSQCAVNILNDEIFGSFLMPNQIIDWMEILIKSKWDFNNDNSVFLDMVDKIETSVGDDQPDCNEAHDMLFKAFSKWLLDKKQYYKNEKEIANLIDLSEIFGEYYDS